MLNSNSYMFSCRFSLIKYPQINAKKINGNLRIFYLHSSAGKFYLTHNLIQW